MTFIRRAHSNSDAIPRGEHPSPKRRGDKASDKAAEALQGFFSRSPKAKKEVDDTHHTSSEVFQQMRVDEGRTKGPDGGFRHSVKHLIKKMVNHTEDPAGRTERKSLERFSGSRLSFEASPEILEEGLDVSGGQSPKFEHKKPHSQEQEKSPDISGGQSPKHENIKLGGQSLIAFNQKEIRDLKGKIDGLRSSTDPDSRQKIDQHIQTIEQKSYENHVILCNLRGVTHLSKEAYLASHQVIDDDDHDIIPVQQ